MEINNFREAFEKGDDPLADISDANDINSVAGVLKLYLRELREPVFSVQYFDQFMELASKLLYFKSLSIMLRLYMFIIILGDFPLPHILNVKEKYNKSTEKDVTHILSLHFIALEITAQNASV